MKLQTSHLSLLIVAGAIVVGGYIIVTSGIPLPGVQRANAQIIATYNSIPTASGKALFLSQSNNLTMSVDPTITGLDSELITCNPNVDSLLTTNPSVGGSCVANGTTLSTTTGMYLGGQCCGPMKDLTEYNKELQNMQQYKNIPDVL